MEMIYFGQGNPILGVHMYLYSDDIVNVNCPEDFDDAFGEGALCHTVSDADGTFSFKSIPCGKSFISILHVDYLFPLILCFFVRA